jgi:hypothetical protein
MLKNQPLFLPRGSIRAILILLLTGWILGAIWYEKSVPESVIVLWAGCIGWYFAGRIQNQTLKQNDQNNSFE